MADHRTSGVWTRPARVLLVDARPETRALLGYALRGDDHDVTTVPMALDIYSFVATDGLRRADQPDVLVVVDHGEDPNLWMMCGVCTKERNIPVVVVKAFVHTHAEAWAQQLGVECLKEPLDSNAMRVAVRRLTGRDALEAELEDAGSMDERVSHVE